MAVPEQTPYIEHIANGSTTNFPLGFYCETKDDLIVTIDGVEPPFETWSLFSGSVVFTTAPAFEKKVVLQRKTKAKRTTDYKSNDNSFRPDTINKDFDRIWLKIQELGIADWILGKRIDALKNYVDHKDDELKAYLMEEIRKQGVALDQLDEYYNYLMKRLAQIATDKGWDASFVVDGDRNQHQINNEQKNINEAFFSKAKESISINDYIIYGENYTDKDFDWSPVFERAIQSLRLRGGGQLKIPYKTSPYGLLGIKRDDGQIVGIEVPFIAGSDFGSTATKIDIVGESQSVKLIPLQSDMIIYRHSSSYCEIGKFQIHHNNKLRCIGVAITPQHWLNPAGTSQQSHNYIRDIYTYGMLDSFILQSGGMGGCYYNTFVNCYAVGTTFQGARGLVLKAGIRSQNQSNKASPPNRNRFYNFKTFSTNVALDIQSGDTNYFYGFSSENNIRTGQFSAVPTALKISRIDSEGHGVQANVFFGLSIEAATSDAGILSDSTRIYGHTLQASKTILSSTFVSSANGSIMGCYDTTVFPEINDGLISNFGGILPAGLPSYEIGRTDGLSIGSQDFGGRFKTYALTLDKLLNVASISNSVSYSSKHNKRVDFECRFNFRPVSNNSVIQIALPFNANYNLYANLSLHDQAFTFPLYAQPGNASARQLIYARIISLDAASATHLEILPPPAGWNTAADGNYNVLHININYRSAQ